MDRLFRIDFYPQDWVIDTSKLTLEQRGLYIQIVAMIYSNRGAIDNDPKWIGGASGCSSRKARQIVLELQSLGFIEISGSKIHQKRCENELKTKRNHIESSEFGGRKSAERRRDLLKSKDIASSDNVVSLPTSSPSPSPSPSSLSKDNDLDTRAETDNDQSKKKDKPNARKSATRLSDDWQPSISHISKCSALGLDCEDLANGLNGFRNYHGSKGSLFVDWDKAFFTWIGNAQRFSAERQQRALAQRSDVRDVSGAALRAAENLRQKRYCS